MDDILPGYPRPPSPIQTGGVLHGLARYPRTDPPPPKQLSLIPTPEDDIIADIKRLAVSLKTKKARLRGIAKKHNITVQQAERLYKSAMERLKHELEYEKYVVNKEYYDWLNTPAHQEYVRLYLAETDRRLQEQERDFRERIANGQEHVVEVISNPELMKYMDIPWAAEMRYHGPMTKACNWLTEHDARILWVNKALILKDGNEATLFNHQFLTKDEIRQTPVDTVVPKEACAKCQTELDYNTVGFNRKIGMSDYQCFKCLDVDPEYAKSVIAFYKSSGCNMFI